MAKKIKKKKSKSKLSPEDRKTRQAQARFHREVREFVLGLGFNLVETDGTEIIVDGRTDLAP